MSGMCCTVQYCAGFFPCPLSLSHIFTATVNNTKSPFGMGSPLLRGGSKIQCGGKFEPAGCIGSDQHLRPHSGIGIGLGPGCMGIYGYVFNELLYMYNTIIR